MINEVGGLILSFPRCHACHEPIGNAEALHHLWSASQRLVHLQHLDSDTSIQQYIYCLREPRLALILATYSCTASSAFFKAQCTAEFISH